MAGEGVTPLTQSEQPTNSFFVFASERKPCGFSGLSGSRFNQLPFLELLNDYCSKRQEKG